MEDNRLTYFIPIEWKVTLGTLVKANSKEEAIDKAIDDINFLRGEIDYNSIIVNEEMYAKYNI